MFECASGSKHGDVIRGWAGSLGDCTDKHGVHAVDSVQRIDSILEMHDCLNLVEETPCNGRGFKQEFVSTFVGIDDFKWPSPDLAPYLPKYPKHIQPLSYLNAATLLGGGGSDVFILDTPGLYLVDGKSTFDVHLKVDGDHEPYYDMYAPAIKKGTREGKRVKAERVFLEHEDTYKRRLEATDDQCDALLVAVGAPTHSITVDKGRNGQYRVRYGPGEEDAVPEIMAEIKNVDCIFAHDPALFHFEGPAHDADSLTKAWAIIDMMAYSRQPSACCQEGHHKQAIAQQMAKAIDLLMIQTVLTPEELAAHAEEMAALAAEAGDGLMEVAADAEEMAALAAEAGDGLMEVSEEMRA